MDEILGFGQPNRHRPARGPRDTLETLSITCLAQPASCECQIVTVRSTATVSEPLPQKAHHNLKHPYRTSRGRTAIRRPDDAGVADVCTVALECRSDYGDLPAPRWAAATDRAGRIPGEIFVANFHPTILSAKSMACSSVIARPATHAVAKAASSS